MFGLHPPATADGVWTDVMAASSRLRRKCLSRDQFLLVPSLFNEVHSVSRLPGGVQRVRADPVGSTADTMSCRIAKGCELQLTTCRLRRDI